VLELVPGAQWASLTRRSFRGVPSTIAASDEVARIADRAQFDGDGGPAIEAMRTGLPVVGFDLLTDSRWPRSRAQLLSRTPVRAVVSIPMGAHGAAASSLNLYSPAHGPFTVTSTLDEAHLLLVDVALAGLQQARRAENLHRALLSNGRIGVAVGVLMNDRGLTEEQAITMLRTASQTLSRKITDLADEVCLTGSFSLAKPSVQHTPPRPL
jgi:hypothetical protein